MIPEWQRSAQPEEISGAMRREAWQEVPDDIDLWEGIETRLSVRRSESVQRSLVQRLFSVRTSLNTAARPGLVRSGSPVPLLFAALLLVWGVTAFVLGRELGARTQELTVYQAATAAGEGAGTDADTDASGDLLLARILDMARLEAVRDAGLLRSMGPSREVGAYGVQVKQVYADAGRLIVGLTAQAPGDLQAQFRTQVSAVLADGQPLRLLNEATSTSSGGTGAHLLIYDTSMLDPLASVRDLRLTVLVADALLNVSMEACSAPFHFDLSVPVTSAGTRIVNIGQTVAAAGEVLTLEQVVITPLATYARVRAGSGDLSTAWSIAELAVMPGALPAGAAGASSLRQYTSSAYIRDGRFAVELDLASAAEDRWTLQVKALSRSDEGGLTSERLRGPWSFELTVPDP